MYHFQAWQVAEWSHLAAVALPRLRLALCHFHDLEYTAARLSRMLPALIQSSRFLKSSVWSFGKNSESSGHATLFKSLIMLNSFVHVLKRCVRVRSTFAKLDVSLTACLTAQWKKHFKYLKTREARGSPGDLREWQWSFKFSFQIKGIQQRGDITDLAQPDHDCLSEIAEWP